MSDLKVVTLNESNFRDPVATLKKIADEIEQGEYGHVGCVGVVVLGNSLEVFGAGEDSAGPSVASVLSAGHIKLVSGMVEHGD